MHERARRLFHGLRTEGAGARREAAAIGVGVFIGCLPIFGFHLLLCWFTCWLLGLNRLKAYVAANISNPLFAPALIFAELQVGAWLRRGSFHQLTLEAVKTTDLSVFGFDVLWGSLVVGAALGSGLAAATYAAVRGADESFLDLVREASDRYIINSITAWEFARAKLRKDPVYRATVCGGVLPCGGTLLDLGCGSGLTLALLATAARRSQAGTWPSGWPPPPQFDRMIGVETRPRVAALARAVLAEDAEIIHGDARSIAAVRCHAVLFFDVLHLNPQHEQDALLTAAVASLEPGGVILVREADAAGGWRFTAVRIGNRLKALAVGRWRQPTFFRTVDGWIAWFSSHGLRADVQPMGEGTPFANVFFRITAPAPVSATSHQPSQVA